MKELGRIKERYDFSFDSRQFGIILLAVAAVVSLVFVLGVSVGRQWERKTATAKPGAPPKVAKPPVQPAALPVVPAAPPVTAPVLKASTTAAPSKEKAKEAALTFPKVLTSNSKSTAPLAKEKDKAKEEAQAGSFTVQVGAYKTRGAAQASVARLKKKGFEARVYDSGGQGGPYRFKLRVGRYADREAARQAARKLKSNENFTPFVTREE